MRKFFMHGIKKSKKRVKAAVSLALAAALVVGGMPVGSGMDANIVAYAEKLTYTEGNSTFEYEVMGDGNMRITDGAFNGAKFLEEVNIPKSVEWIENDAFNCYSLKNINVAEGNMAYTCKDGALFDKTQTNLILCFDKSVQEYQVSEGVETIDDCAFWGCCKLTEVLLPDSLTRMGYCAFEGCTGKWIGISGN